MSASSKSEFEKLLGSSGEEKWRKAVEFRKANKEWLSLSGDIALKVMDEMERQGISGRELAKRMDVSPQQVSKIVKGRENLKLETIAKLSSALGVTLIQVLDANDPVDLISETIVQETSFNINEILQQSMLKPFSDRAAVNHGFLIATEINKSVSRENVKIDSDYAIAG
jgi:transcriptional regulator with XRE-family HTH domain